MPHASIKLSFWASLAYLASACSPAGSEPLFSDDLRVEPAAAAPSVAGAGVPGAPASNGSAIRGDDEGSPSGLPGVMAGAEPAVGEPAPSSGSGEPASPGSAGCGAGTPGVGGRRSLTVGDAVREYVLVLPDDTEGPVPLVIALHGYTMTSTTMASMTGLSAIARTEGFALAYPQGVGLPTGWNAGACCAFNDEARPDLEFMTRLLDELDAELCIDRSRVYVAGFSNGGMMSYRMACEMADRVAAVVSVSGSIAISLDECSPSRPVPVLHVHGTADPIVPYAGGLGPVLLTPIGATTPTYPSVADEMERFAAFNDCTGPVETVIQRLDSTCERRTACANGSTVQLCTITGGGHTWPSGGIDGIPSLVVGPESQTLPISEMLWEFVAAHRLPD